MTASNILSFPHSRHYRRDNVRHMHGASIHSFADHLPPVERADVHRRQASDILALSSRLYFSAYLAAINAALAIAGLHVPNNGRETCAKENPKSPKLSPDGAA